ncbi:MAG: hypothetical protein H6727_03845 [Myxococcales bacterium]|nr:hypothetical protein [Myxococcales bacterium]
MAEVIAEGHVDMIGMGRPMIVEPDLPARILRGEAEAALQINPSTGIKKADAFLQNLWYGKQMARMGNGLDPDLKMGLWSTILVGVFMNLPYHPRRWRWQPKPKAA